MMETLAHCECGCAGSNDGDAKRGATLMISATSESQTSSWQHRSSPPDNQENNLQANTHPTPYMPYDEFYFKCLHELNGASSAQAQLNPAYASAEVMNELEWCDAISQQQALSARRGASTLQAHECNSSSDVTNEFERCNAMTLQQAHSARNAGVILQKQQQNMWDGVTNELERCNAMSLQQARSARQAAAAMQHEQHECNNGDVNHPVGVGIVLLQHDEDAERNADRTDTKRGHHVVAVAPDSPAGKSKYVFPGDMLVEIDGTDVRGYDAAELRPYILGMPGSQVVLGFRPLYSDVDGDTKYVRLTRSAIAHAGQEVTYKDSHKKVARGVQGHAHTPDAGKGT